VLVIRKGVNLENETLDGDANGELGSLPRGLGVEIPFPPISSEDLLDLVEDFILVTFGLCLIYLTRIKCVWVDKASLVLEFVEIGICLLFIIYYDVKLVLE
jgi:hypothetical protein